MSAGETRAGAARVDVTPPPGLGMVGFVRRHQPAREVLHRLEVTALALESAGRRAVVIGVDTLGIQAPEVDALRERVARAADADPACVLLNWNHTHCAPAGGRTIVNLGGGVAGEPLSEAALAYVDRLHEAVVEAARQAVAALVPARVAWGVGEVDESVNRRERAADGRVILGWNPDGMRDPQVVVLQARRRDDSVLCTLVGWGCHPVTVGPDVLAYSADFPGPTRDAVRAWTGGECVFVQGAAGNILPRVAFADGAEAERVGRRLALEALRAVADREAWPQVMSRRPDGSVTPFSLYRPVAAPAPAPIALEAAEERVALPLLPLPSADELADLAAGFAAELEAARAEGADQGRLNTIRYHLDWARAAEAEIRSGAPRTSADGPVTALRIGDGVIVTGPGEVSAEIGLAVRERSPAPVTLYAGYTNGAVSYLPAASSYAAGGYEPGYGNRSFGLPAQVAPACDRILVETGLLLAASLFPGAPAHGPEGWLASGRLPDPPAPTAWEPPAAG